MLCDQIWATSPYIQLFPCIPGIGTSPKRYRSYSLAPVVDIPFKSYQAEAFKPNVISKKLLKVLDKKRFRTRSFKFIIKFNFESVFVECCVVNCAWQIFNIVFTCLRGYLMKWSNRLSVMNLRGWCHGTGDVMVLVSRWRKSKQIILLFVRGRECGVHVQ